MKSFEETVNKTYTFGSCQTCEANCCDGRKGSVMAPINLEDFELVSQYFPIAFILGELGFIQPVVLLNGSKTFCRYIKNHQCSIYENRPSICRIYPLSPTLDNRLFIDTNCPAINTPGEEIIKEGRVQESFMDEKLMNHQTKCVATYVEFKNLSDKKNYKELIRFNDSILYRLKENQSNNYYLNLHLNSLNHFDDYYKIK